MTATVHAARPVTTTDRFGIMLFLAVVLHALLILGLNFQPLIDQNKRSDSPTLDVTIVNTVADQKPEKADYLAQANQQGGGNTEDKLRPESAPIAAVDVIPTPGNADAMQVPVEARTTPEPIASTPVTAAAAPNKILVGDDQPKPQDPVPVAAELVRKSMDMVQLEAELAEITRLHSKAQRTKLLVPNTVSHVEAAYLDSWQKKIELVGNMNYPEKARKQHLSGKLLLVVSINADGSLADVELVRSSGQKVLDDAAIRIVKLAAPYPPLPDAIRKDADVLKIPRIWNFSSGNTLSTQSAN
jgi:protein TonB